MADPFLQLPDEVLLPILQCTRASSTLSNFVGVLRVCKRFHTIGRSVAFELLSLTNDNFDNWCQSTKYIGGQYAQVKHLTVTLCFEYYHTPSFKDYSYRNLCSQVCISRCADLASPCLNRPESRLRELSFAIETIMQSLVTFALVLKVQPDHAGWCLCREPCVATKYLARLIEAMPATLENLMLDTAGSDERRLYPQYYANHTFGNCGLCNSLVTCLPTLKNIWLRVGSLCPYFFVPKHDQAPDLWHSCSAVQSWFRDQGDYSDSIGQGYSRDTGYDTFLRRWFSNGNTQIRREYENRARDAQNQQQEHQPLNCSVFGNLVSMTINLAVFPMRHNRVGADYGVKFAKALQLAVNQWKCFPNLASCHVICQHNEPMSSEEWDILERECAPSAPGRLNFDPFSELFVFDVIGNSTTVLPFRWTVPESKMRASTIQSQRPYAFYNLTLSRIIYGSFSDLDMMLQYQLPGGWNTDWNDELLLPADTARAIPGLILQDPYMGLSRGTVEILASRSKEYPRWLRRADACIAQKHVGLLDHFEVRDPVTGSLGTQNPYTV